MNNQIIEVILKTISRKNYTFYNTDKGGNGFVYFSEAYLQISIILMPIF